MDFSDLVPATPPEAPAQNKSSGEELVEILAYIVFPTLTFVMTWAGFVAGSLVLPPLLAAVTFAVSRRVRARASITALAVVVCVMASFLAGVAGGLLASL